MTTIQPDEWRSTATPTLGRSLCAFFQVSFSQLQLLCVLCGFLWTRGRWGATQLVRPLFDWTFLRTRDGYWIDEP